MRYLWRRGGDDGAAGADDRAAGGDDRGGGVQMARADLVEVAGAGRVEMAGAGWVEMAGPAGRRRRGPGLLSSRPTPCWRALHAAITLATRAVRPGALPWV